MEEIQSTRTVVATLASMIEFQLVLHHEILGEKTLRLHHASCVSHTPVVNKATQSKYYYSVNQKCIIHYLTQSLVYQSCFDMMTSSIKHQPIS